MSDDPFGSSYANTLKTFNSLEAKLGVKVLRSAMRRAVRPTLNTMKAKVPTGSKAHRTYKGRLVSPGYLKRSIKVVSTRNRATKMPQLVIGVSKEAFYGVSFLDTGTKLIASRRKAKLGRRRGGAKIALKHPYQISPRHWFKIIFITDADNITNRVARELAAGLRKLK